MTSLVASALAVAMSVAFTAGPAAAEGAGGIAPGSVSPPYAGTAWISPDVITPTAPTDLISLAYAGMQTRRTFDRRVDDWVTLRSHIFRATFGCARRTVDVVVNPEFTLTEATTQAERFADVVGRLPPGSRAAVAELWIHAGRMPMGGGNGALTIHTDVPEREWPFIEEVLLHEAAHASLDPQFGAAVDWPQWRSLRESDPGFVSEYARDYPDREDIAESYGAFALVRAADARLDLRADAQTITAVIPNRLAYLESLGSAYVPGTTACPVYGASGPPGVVRGLSATSAPRSLRVTWRAPSNLGGATTVNFEYRVNAGPWRPTLGSSVRVRGASGQRIAVQVRAVNPAGPGKATAVTARPR